MARKIEIEIVGDAKNFQNSLGKAAGSADSFGSSIARMGKLAAIAIGAAGIGGIAIVLKQGIAEFSEAAKVGAQTNAVLASTGGIANVTAGEVSKLASALMAKSGVDDEAIQSGENMLLTFTKVRNEVGAGNDIFNQGTKAALDLSVALGKDMPAAAMLVGKALNDPIKGMTALTRAGIQFTDEQKKTIAALVKTGDTMGAQKIILKELTTQFGGSAEALGKTLPGQLNILKETFNNLAGTMVGAMVPAFTKVVEGASTFLTKFGEADGASAKFGVAMDAIKSIASDAAAGLVAVFNKIDWSKTWDTLVASAGTVATRLRDALDQKLGAVDWGNVGAKIADGISNAIQAVGAIGQKIGNTITLAMHKINWVDVGRTAGPGLAAALVTAFATIMDVSFWIKNWDLALAVGLAMFGKGIGKLVGPLGTALQGALGKAFDDAIQAVVVVAAKLGPLVEKVVLAGLLVVKAMIVRTLEGFVAVVRSAFGKLGALAQFTVKVLGITAAINAIGQFVSEAWGKFKELLGKIATLPGEFSAAAAAIGRAIVAGILSGLTGLPGALGSKLKGYIDSAVGFAGGLLRGSGDFMFTAHRIGEPMGQGIVDGLGRYLANAGPRGAAIIAAFTARMKAQFDASMATFGAAFEQLGGYIERAFGARTQQLVSALGAAFDVQIGKIRAWGDAASESVRKLAAELTQAERALNAFDAALSKQGPTASETELSNLDTGEAKRSREMAVEAANAALVKAQAVADVTERAAAVAAAEEQIRTAQLAVTRARLTEQVATERAARDAANAATRAHLVEQAGIERAARDAEAAARIAAIAAEVAVQTAAMEAQKAAELQNLEEFRRIQGEQMTKKLGELTAHLAKHPKEWAKTQAAIIKLLKGYGVDFKSAGELLGNAFANGMTAATKAVEKAASGLAKAAAKYFPHSPAEKGPLSKPINWKGYLTDGLPSGRALAGMASGMVSGAVGVRAGGGGSFGGGSSGGGSGGGRPLVLQTILNGRVVAEEIYPDILVVDKRHGGRLANFNAPILS